MRVSPDIELIPLQGSIRLSPTSFAYRRVASTQTSPRHPSVSSGGGRIPTISCIWLDPYRYFIDQPVASSSALVNQSALPLSVEPSSTRYSSSFVGVSGKVPTTLQGK
jgi:hypothetical protein